MKKKPKKNKDIYEENPFGPVKLGKKILRLEDLINVPSPAQVAASLKTSKVTLSLDNEAIRFFKEQAKKYDVPYQAMIRSVLSDYVTRISK